MNSSKYLVFSLLASALLIFTQCERLDETSPVLKLVGEDTVRIQLGGSYLEEGAIAVDDTDGDISESVFIDNSDVNEDLVGTYEVLYQVADSEANTASDERLVQVFAGADDYAGSYDATRLSLPDSTLIDNYIVILAPSVDGDIIANNLMNDNVVYVIDPIGDLGNQLFINQGSINGTGELLSNAGVLDQFELLFDLQNSIDSVRHLIELVEIQ